MKEIINGGIYAIDLQGNHTYEFIGIHPAIIIRTLKEEEVYMVVPLTTYTKDRWDRCRRSGFGCRILSTNSIARVDKYKVVSRSQIKDRYYNNNRILIADKTEVLQVMNKLQEYVMLSDQKGLREYSKYQQQKIDYVNDVQNMFDALTYDETKYQVINDVTDVIIIHDKSIVTHLSVEDLHDTYEQIVGSCKRTIEINGDKVKIKINKTNNYILTFGTNYDTLKSQKSSSNT